MGVLSYWPLLFLIFIPIILLLYLFKQKAEQKDISSLYLWREAFKNMEAATPWEKFRHNLLLYLQILTMLALILALLGPYLKKGGDEYKNIILVLDNSGSMNTLYDETGSRLEVAKEKAKEYVQAAQGDVLVTVISGNKTAKLEVSNASNKKVLEKIIDDITETDYSGNLSSTINMVESMVGQWENYEAVFFSDQGVAMNSIHGKLVSLQSEGVNGAIDYVSHALDEEGNLTVLVKVSNYGTDNFISDINLYMGEKIIDIKQVSLIPQESQILYFESITKDEYEEVFTTGGVIKAEINETDSLKNDNIFYDKLIVNQTKKVLLVTEQNIFLEKALKTQDTIELYKTAKADNITSTEEETFDLYVFDGVVPKELPEKGNFIFINPPENISLEDTLLFQIGENKGAVKVKTNHSIVNDSLGDFSFGVNQYKSIEKPSWAEAFFEAGDACLGFIGTIGERRVGILTFDLHQSDLPLQTEFPIFMYNFLGQCLESGLVKNTVLTVGDNIEIFSAYKAENIIITSPKKEKTTLPISSTRITYLEADESGIYTITEQKKDTTLSEQVVFNFPVSTESKQMGKISVTGTDEMKNGDVISANSITGGRNLRNMVILLCLFLLLIEWIVYRRTYHMPGKKRKWVIQGIRIVIAVLLLLAFFDIDINLSSRKTTTLFLLDVSESVAGYTPEGETFIKEALKRMPKKEAAGVIAFGKDARVEQFVTEKNLFSKVETTPITIATNLEKSVQSALALFPENSGKRLVLITDGNENEGSLKQMAPTLLANQVSTEILKISDKIQKEVYVDNVSVPDKVNIGDTFQVKVQIQSNIRTAANLYLYSGSELKAKEEITLQAGENQFIFKDTQTASGLKSYRVIIEPKEDTRSVNNEYVAFTQAQSGEKILLIEGELGKGNAFEKVIKAANIIYDKCVPEAAPRSLLEMNEYKSILLLDVYADDLPEAFLTQIESYVKDYAGGFIAIGGEDSFALGNYRNTPLEKILPVSMDLKGEKQIPETAIAMVIDHSGSMSDGNEYVTLLDLAKRAASEAVYSLRSIDYAGVLAFSESFDWIVPMQKATDQEEIEDEINKIPLGGGTSIYPAVKEAYEQLKKCKAKVKHIILLTDGQDGFGAYDDLLKDLQDNDITLSTVAVGEGSDGNLLGRLADQGGGRYYYTDINSDIPRIFAQEVFLSAKSYLVQGEFTPIITSNSDMIHDVILDGIPSMYGYIASSKKDLAVVHLESDKEDPILTSWQYGLGKTIAFNSDGVGKWTANYHAWNQYPLLWKNIIQWTMTDTTGGDNSLVVSSEDNISHLTYKTKEYTQNSSVTGVYTDEKGNTKEVILEATAPGVFEGDIELLQTGIYSVNVSQKEDGEIKNSQNTALAMQYSSEYRFTKDSKVLEDFAVAAGATFINKSEDVFTKKLSQISTTQNLTWLFLVLAILLFMLDIANRRLHFSLNFIKKIQKSHTFVFENIFHKKLIDENEQRPEENKKHPSEKMLRKAQKNRNEKVFRETKQDRPENASEETKQNRTENASEENKQNRTEKMLEENKQNRIQNRSEENKENGEKILSKGTRQNMSEKVSKQNGHEKDILDTKALLRRKQDRSE